MPSRFLGLALLALAGCSDAPGNAPDAGAADAGAPAIEATTPGQPAAPLTDAERTLREADATAAATAFHDARDGSTACAQATGAATAFREAGRTADADRWQATADSACAALQPDIDRTLARISDSLAAAE
ncbi:MAG TPA: hypothetical protein VF594_05970 [Rubricoccaceae bacterium]|jgi:hypothetical protein